MSRAAPEVEALAAELDGRASMEEGLSTVERRTRQVCRVLASDLQRIREDQLRKVIEEVLNVSSKPTIRQYIDRVADEFNLTKTESPGGTVVYVAQPGDEPPDHREQAAAETEIEFDRLDQAEAATDGGEVPPD